MFMEDLDGGDHGRFPNAWFLSPIGMANPRVFFEEYAKAYTEM